MLSENVGIVVKTRDEKTAPPINARLQKGHWIQNRQDLLFKLCVNECTSMFGM